MTAANAPAALKAPSDLPDAARLNVAVMEFDPGLPADGNPVPDGFYPEIRKAEATLFSVQLRNTLAETEQWGASSVVPTEPFASDVTLSGTILRSDGREFQLRVLAEDASGQTWFERKYRTVVPKESYQSSERVEDPYQPMFNTIANDLVSKRSKLKRKELEQISTISELRFASDLSPEAFEGYLAFDSKGNVEILRLPALDDPMLERVAEVRMRDEMFAEIMGIRYESFASGLEENYWHWRAASTLEIEAKEALRREQITRGIVVGLTVLLVASAASGGDASTALLAAAAGATIIEQQMAQISALGQQREMHEEGLRELGRSFQAEVQPLVIELAATNVRLTGTAAAQYEEWKRLLRAVYNAENDVIAEVYLAMRRPTEEPWSGETVLPRVLIASEKPAGDASIAPETLVPVFSGSSAPQ